MHTHISEITAMLSAYDPALIRILSMFAVLLVALSSGYLAEARFKLPPVLPSRIMTFVLAVLNWPIAIYLIWQMQLGRDLIWLPIAGVIVLAAATALSILVFSAYKTDFESKLTLILAGGLSNLGYTGGAFVCYALFGLAGLGLAYIYLMLWIPATYLGFFPVLKIIEQRRAKAPPKAIFASLADYRMLVIPAVAVGFILNIAQVKQPAFIDRLHLADIFIYTASALAFFAIGLRVTFGRLKAYVPLYFPLSAVKFLLTPAVALLVLWVLSVTGQGLSPLARNVTIVQSAAPSAVMMVTICHVFKLDSSLASALWVVSTAVFVVIVVPILFFVFV